MKKILSITNFLLSILLIIILFFNDMSDNFVYIITLSLFIGWIIPYLSLIISGLTISLAKHNKKSFIFNILSFLLCLLLIYLMIKIYDKKLLIVIIEYAIIAVLNFINSIYFITYIIKNPDLEIKKIKEDKKKNNGIIT